MSSGPSARTPSPGDPRPVLSSRPRLLSSAGVFAFVVIGLFLVQGLAAQGSPRPTVVPISPAGPSAHPAPAVRSLSSVSLDVKSVPSWPNYGTPTPTNWNISPTLGVHSVAVSQSVTLWANFTPPSCSSSSYCYYENLTFLSWTGSGLGSVNSNQTTITVKMAANITETANFLADGQCSGYAPIICVNLTGYGLTFAQKGLPSGVTWEVTLDGRVTGTSSGSTMGFSVSDAPVTYTVWSVPSKGGKLWVPTEDASSPVQVPATSQVDVSFTLESPALATFDLNVSEAGLPNGSRWSVNVGGVGYSVGPTGADIPVAGGGNLPLNGSFVYTNSGSGYYATNVSYLRYVVNSTGIKTQVVPASVPVNGSLALTVHYLPMYRLTTSGNAGGSVSPSSHWVMAGGLVNLTAVPAPGHYFLTWSGSGTGATAGPQDLLASTSIRLGGPVTEVAEFLAIPARTWNVTVVAGNLPNGTAFGVTFGGNSYDGFDSIVIPRVSSGSYSVSCPDLYLNASESTRFTVSHVSSSFPSGVGGFSVLSNGTIWVNYSTEYTLTVSATPNGVTSPSAGVTWEPAGSVVPLTASASFHYRFVAWNGSGAGAFVGTVPTGSATMNGPVTESAQFVWRVFPVPAAFWLQVSELGLPTGTPWEVTAGTTGASASGSVLTLNGLNGSYVLTVPPSYIAAGTRYLPTGGGTISVNVSANASISINFTQEFLLTVLVAQGGTTSAVTSWEPAGTQLQLVATPQSGWHFESWNGSGTGSYTGTQSTTSITVTGPMTESVSFAPVYAAPQSSASNSGAPVAIGLLVVGLLVGLVAAVSLARRGRRPPADSSGEPTAEDDGPAPDPEYDPGLEGSPAEEGGSEPIPEYSEEPAPQYASDTDESFDPDVYRLPPMQPAPYDEGPPD
ncbi:MAG: hypothetical protein L3K19_02860 [Thermoplasmata archaeon]|nr:hypothetical protein [Thermoplasmata archaeon]